VTRDYQLALKAFNETKGVNCIFEIHYSENENTLNTVFTVDEIYNKDIYFISIYEQFDLNKIIKLENNKYKIILQFNDDKVASFRRAYDLSISEENDCKNILPTIKKNNSIISVNIWTNINNDILNSTVESVVKKRIRPCVIKFSNYDFFADKNIEYLTRLFYNNKDLRIILGYQFLCDSLLTSYGAEKLYQALILNKTILLLDLRNNNIGPEGSMFIASMIKDCKSLEHIYLGNNNIGNEGVKLIAEALKTKNKIEKIILDMNEISDIGLAYICETIRVNDTLVSLSLEDNLITNEGLKMFVNVLAVNYSLLSVGFENNLFTEEYISYLLDLLNPNNTGRYAGSSYIRTTLRLFKYNDIQTIKINNLTIIIP
jgi:hypothetical protein